MKQSSLILSLVALSVLLFSCTGNTVIPNIDITSTQTMTTSWAVPLGHEISGSMITLDTGGDVDTAIINIGSPARDAHQSGNGKALPSPDGNSTQDFYIQFQVADDTLFEGQPTPSIRLDIEYFDQGTDSFIVQYDSVESGPYKNGTFKETRPVYKTNTLQFKTASFVIKDGFFGNRDNGADFRISDQSDGPEIISTVKITLLPIPNIISVDSCGANPYDDLPDGQAINTCIAQSKAGDIILFTSGETSPQYTGYLIDKTIFLETSEAKRYLTFTSSDPKNPALLKATADLKGFVVRLYARSMINYPGEVDYITISDLHLDGNREERICLGPDGIDNGIGDNWGSWLSECTAPGDPWCSPGTLDLAGAVDWKDYKQDYVAHASLWSTGLVADGLHITNNECATAFGMEGAANVIMDTTIETAGDHVHGTGCAETDPDLEGLGDWSDGMTLFGPGHLIFSNTIINPSDVGIVYFGGRGTIIRNNLVQVTPGNHGAFAGIAIHPWSLGDIGFGQVVGNTVISQGDPTCGGIHAGINLGPHMWSGGCSYNDSSAVGNATCSQNPPQPKGKLCPLNSTCQKWAYVPADTTYMLIDNTVTGAQINYLVEGLDLVGTLIQDGNVSNTPQRSDWGASRVGCDGITWGALDFVAHDPSLPNWTNLRIHCE
jgi:hypothetical protein